MPLVHCSVALTDEDVTGHLSECEPLWLDASQSGMVNFLVHGRAEQAEYSHGSGGSTFRSDLFGPKKRDQNSSRSLSNAPLLTCQPFRMRVWRLETPAQHVSPFTGTHTLSDDLRQVPQKTAGRPGIFERFFKGTVTLAARGRSASPTCAFEVPRDRLNVSLWQCSTDCRPRLQRNTPLLGHKLVAMQRHDCETGLAIPGNASTSS